MKTLQLTLLLILTLAIITGCCKTTRAPIMQPCAPACNPIPHVAPPCGIRVPPPPPGYQQ